MDTKQLKSRKSGFFRTNSLRLLLVFWFVIVSLVPLMFLTFYSVNKLEGVVKDLYQDNLKVQSEKISNEIKGWVDTLQLIEQSINNEKSVQYFVANRQYEDSARAIQKLMPASDIDLVQVFDRNRKLVNYFEKSKAGVFFRNLDREQREYYLAGRVKKSSDSPVLQMKFLEGRAKAELSLIAPLKTNKNRLIGYIMLAKHVDKKVVEKLKDKFNTDVIFYFDKDVISTIKYKKLWSLSKGFKKDKFSKVIQIGEQPYSGYSDVISMGGKSFKVVVLQSSSPLVELIENISMTFISVALLILLFMGIAWFFMTKTILRPIDSLLEAINKMRNGERDVMIQDVPNNELGLVVENFNAMSEQVLAAQGKLVHQAKMASLGELVAGVAHELNNAISFIFGNIDPLKDYLKSLKIIIKSASKSESAFKKALKDEDYAYIEKDMPKLIKSISEGALRTKDIVQGLKTFSRVDEGSDKEFDLVESLNTTIALIPGQLTEKVDIKIESKPSLTVRGNPGQLNQVFLNLLINAAQSIKGSGKIVVKISKIRGNVVVSFKDTGKGIKPAEMDRIFDPFYTTKPQGEGSGLGLSISYGIIQSHGGDIAVQSKVGKGSEFTITLPE